MRWTNYNRYSNEREHYEDMLEELRLMVVLARVQIVEIRSAIDAEEQGFTIDHEGARPATKRSLEDERKRLLQSYPLRVKSPTPLPWR